MVHLIFLFLFFNNNFSQNDFLKQKQSISLVKSTICFSPIHELLFPYKNGMVITGFELDNSIVLNIVNNSKNILNYPYNINSIEIEISGKHLASYYLKTKKSDISIDPFDQKSLTFEFSKKFTKNDTLIENFVKDIINNHSNTKWKCIEKNVKIILKKVDGTKIIFNHR